jgi:hypothetical protein
MPVLDKPKRRGRLITEPHVWNGKVVKIELTERDTEIFFPIFDHYPKAGLPWNYYHALMGDLGGNPHWFAERCSHMACEPNNQLIKPGYQTSSGKARSRPEIYMRADQTISQIEWHDLMTNMYMAQIELGTRADGFFYIRGFPKASPPPQNPPTYNRKRPHEITILFTPPKGKERTETVARQSGLEGSDNQDEKPGVAARI